MTSVGRPGPRAAALPATEQASAEAARAQLAAIVEASGDAIISLTMDGAIETWNEGAEQLYGYSAEEAVGKNVLSLLARDPAERDANLADMLAGSEPQQTECHDVRKDGSLLDVSVTGSLIRDPEGQVVGIARIARDVTERTNAEAARARLAAIVEASGDAIISLTTDGVIETWNQSAVQLYGYSAEEAVGKNVLSLLAHDPAERKAMLANVVAASEPARADCQDVRRDGSLVEVAVTDSPILDAKGRVIGIARIARDVTTRVEAESATRKAEAQVAAGRDQALEASRMKSAFLANMSHEIRTPLNGVIGMADLLLDSPLDQEQRENARLLRGAGETLVAVVNDILDFSKIEAGALRLEYVDFDLIDAVEDACDLIAESAREKKVELTMHLAPELPEIVRGDATRVRQVITNLLSNAIKFTSVGEIRVTLRMMPSSDDRTRLHFEVADTGIGIDKNRLEQMFTPFMQADDSMTRRFGGSGLGLAIVKQLVEMMGGEVGAESVLGEGSRFWFTVALEHAQVPIRSDDQHTTLAGTRLLAVDDNETNRRLIVQLGRRWEMDVTAVSCAAEALEQLREAAARQKPFQCAALDLHMPDTNGIELAQAIFRDQTFPAPALVMLTSTADDRREAHEAGIDVYMTKPVRRTRLFNALAEAIGIKTRRQQVPVEVEDDVHASSSPMILVAEDNDVNQILAIRMLHRRGYRVEAVGDGRQAVEALDRRRYAAVLMDCQMPEQDGYDATGEVRLREPVGRHTPVIAMTAHALGGDREKCLASGMDDYLAKPITPDELDRVLRRWAPRIMEGADGEARTVNTTVDAPAAKGPLDPAGIKRLGDELGSIEALKLPIELFATQTPELLADMRRAIDAGDAETVRGDAHKLKGGCMTLAATHMAELCGELELRLGADSLAGATMLVDQIEGAFEQAHAALLAEVASGR
jgi:two-component system, sensor histidine kinase and response regulator